MAVFGAPVAVENHAVRACRAALDVQARAADLRAEVADRDGVELSMRIGINSGRVIAGGTGPGALGYRATGDQVGYAQRMEAVAPAGGVAVSESTARLVADSMELSDVEWVHIKGHADRVPIRRLISARTPTDRATPTGPRLVGRASEIGAIKRALDDAVAGTGASFCLVGPPGIGKSRIAQEAAAIADDLGAVTAITYCDSHAVDVPFHAAAALLRAALGTISTDDAAARALVAERLADRTPEDRLLLCGLLGIVAPGEAAPAIDPDARRRRLTALIGAALPADGRAVLVIVEDAHWIDEASEALLVDAFLREQTSTLLLVTTRPEYHGALATSDQVKCLQLGPLADAEAAALWTELVGVDPSLRPLADIVATRAAGNPFFLEEIVRDLAQRGVLTGEPGRYVSHTDAAVVTVPATVHTLIEARLDRLPAEVKHGVHAAAAIGIRFSAGLLADIGVEPDLAAAVHAELVDQVHPGVSPDYTFRHPLIHAVAYESQLRSDRMRWHRQIAAAIERREPTAVEANAALIAEHLLAADEPGDAYGWLMRAGAWAAQRDIDAARRSWDRARQVADALPADHPQLLQLRIAPRTMLSATDFQAQSFDESRGRFVELRELCELADDKVSLVIGMTALASELNYAQSAADAARLASEQVMLLESIDDPALTVGLSFVAFMAWHDVADYAEILRWSQVVIDTANGDHSLGSAYGLGSPLALAHVFRGLARGCLGKPGWRDDYDRAILMCADCDATTRVLVGVWSYGVASVYGLVRADDDVLSLLEGGARAAHESGSDVAVLLADYSHAGFLILKGGFDSVRRGQHLLSGPSRDLPTRMPSLVLVFEMMVGWGSVQVGEFDTGIDTLRTTTEALIGYGRRGYASVSGWMLAISLIERGTDADLREATAVLDRLRGLWPDAAPPLYELWTLRISAMLARARDEDAAADLATRYLAMAHRLQCERHIDWAEGLLPPGAG